MTTLKEFFQRMAFACDQFDRWATAYNPEARADHIGYKCATNEEYETIRALLEPYCTLQQSLLSGRRVAIVEFGPNVPCLHDPSGRAANQTFLGTLRYLELSDQKPDLSQRSGFDHVEIYPLIGTPDDLAATLEKLDPRNTFSPPKRAHHATRDLILPSIQVRIEPRPLMDKIEAERRARS